MSDKCVFLDRDGVINEERGTYTFTETDFILLEGVADAIRLLKNNQFKVIVITNQSGISQGLYSLENMLSCHRKMMSETNQLIDDIYYSKWHPSISESLSRKPDSLMLERAIAYHQIDIGKSWMIGDKERDIESALKVGMKTILISQTEKLETQAGFIEKNLIRAVENIILKN